MRLFQIIFNPTSAAELARMPKELQLQILGEFRGLPQQVLNTELDQFGKLERAGRTLHRFRVGDYRVYFERHDLGLVVHRILNRHTLKDFLFRSGLKVQEAGTLEVDRYSLETSRERFYAGGDLITGASNVSNAMGIGKKAARNIDKRLMGQERFPSLIPDFEYLMVPPETPSEFARHVPGEMPAAQRVQSYAEVSLGLTAVAALEETARCLRCDLRSVER